MGKEERKAKKAGFKSSRHVPGAVVVWRLGRRTGRRERKEAEAEEVKHKEERGEECNLDSGHLVDPLAGVGVDVETTEEGAEATRRTSSRTLGRDNPARFSSGPQARRAQRTGRSLGTSIPRASQGMAQARCNTRTRKNKKTTRKTERREKKEAAVAAVAVVAVRTQSVFRLERGERVRRP